MHSTNIQITSRLRSSIQATSQAKPKGDGNVHKGTKINETRIFLGQCKATKLDDVASYNLE